MRVHVWGCVQFYGIASNTLTFPQVHPHFLPYEDLCDIAQLAADSVARKQRPDTDIVRTPSESAVANDAGTGTADVADSVSAPASASSTDFAAASPPVLAAAGAATVHVSRPSGSASAAVASGNAGNGDEPTVAGKQALHSFRVLEIPLNLLESSAAFQVLPWAVDRGVSVVTNRPLNAFDEIDGAPHRLAESPDVRGAHREALGRLRASIWKAAATLDELGAGRQRKGSLTTLPSNRDAANAATRVKQPRLTDEQAPNQTASGRSHAQPTPPTAPRTPGDAQETQTVPLQPTNCIAPAACGPEPSVATPNVTAARHAAEALVGLLEEAETKFVTTGLTNTQIPYCPNQITNFNSSLATCSSSSSLISPAYLSTSSSSPSSSPSSSSSSTSSSSPSSSSSRSSSSSSSSPSSSSSCSSSSSSSSPSSSSSRSSSSPAAVPNTFVVDPISWDSLRSRVVFPRVHAAFRRLFGRGFDSSVAISTCHAEVAAALKVKQTIRDKRSGRSMIFPQLEY
eukprot:GHVT01073139.1.p1 GENE.GHVT01073139.1~~GHVT01073139.1.p1  ORF type:complete len:513 (-),score=151.76 GHVT01073139.1:203-1741(-)